MQRVIGREAGLVVGDPVGPLVCCREGVRGVVGWKGEVGIGYAWVRGFGPVEVETRGVERPAQDVGIFADELAGGEVVVAIRRDGDDGDEGFVGFVTAGLREVRCGGGGDGGGGVRGGGGVVQMMPRMLLALALALAVALVWKVARIQ